MCRLIDPWGVNGRQDFAFLSIDTLSKTLLEG